MQNILITFLSFAMLSTPAFSDPLIGSTDSACGVGWCASWLDLSEDRDFSVGERLCLNALGGPEVLGSGLIDLSRR